MSGRPKRKTTREPGGARQTKLTKFFGNSSTVKSAPRGKDSQCVPEQVSGSRCQETTDEIVVIRDESGDEQGGASHPAGTCVVSNAPPEGQEVAQEAFWRCGNDGMNPPKVAHVATEQIQACSEPSVPNTLQRVSSAPTPNSDGTVPCDTKLVIDSDSRPRQRGLAEASYGHGECQGEGSDHDTGVENLLTSGIAVLADTCSFNPSLFPMPPLIPFKIQTHFLKLVSSTKSRLQITALLTNLFRLVHHYAPEDLMRTFYLLSNRIGPSHQANGELGVGTSMVMKAVQESSPKSSAEIRKLWKSHGDLGDVAFQAKSSQKLLFKPRPLTIRALYDTLVKISLTRGATNKAKMIQSLLASAVGEETRWLCRILIQNIRIGAVRTTVLTAIAHAIEIERPSFEGSMRVRCRKAELAVKEAYVRCADERVVIPVLLRHSVSEVARYCPTRIGIPILPMLGRITRDLLSVLDLMKDRAFLCDFKYDGQRAQVHGNIDKNRSVLIFSRHLEDITEQYPDLVQLVQQEYSDAGPFILDCEVVAISDSGEPLPMQILSTRSKKNVSIESIRVKVCLKAFDIMFHEEPLITKSLRERRQRMGEIFREVPGRFNLCECMVIEQNCPDTDRAAKVEGFLRAAIDSGCEGLMVKCLDDYVACVDADIEEGPVLARKGPGSLKKVLLANYEPDKRSESWLKVKKDYVEGMADSFDVVPIGAWWGMGRKAGWYSPILMAVWNPYLGMYETLCKCMSGFTDEFYKEFTASQTTLPEKPSDYRVGDSLVASVWFPPSEVWEIRGADLTASTAHTADKAEDGCDRGISLRFPRFVRKRPDKKTPDGVTTSFAVREMFDSQISRRREC